MKSIRFFLSRLCKGRLVKLVMFSGTVHMVTICSLSSLKFAVGSVQVYPSNKKFYLLAVMCDHLSHHRLVWMD